MPTKAESLYDLVTDSRDMIRIEKFEHVILSDNSPLAVTHTNRFVMPQFPIDGETVDKNLANGYVQELADSCFHGRPLLSENRNAKIIVDFSTRNHIRFFTSTNFILARPCTSLLRPIRQVKLLDHVGCMLVVVSLHLQQQGSK